MSCAPSTGPVLTSSGTGGHGKCAHAQAPRAGRLQASSVDGSLTFATTSTMQARKLRHRAVGAVTLWQGGIRAQASLPRVHATSDTGQPW